MGHCTTLRSSTLAGSASLPACDSHNPDVKTARTPLTALSKALSDLKELVADPRVSWKGKDSDAKDCAALEKVLQECEACVAPAAHGGRLQEPAQRVTDNLAWKAAQSTQLRRFSTLKCRKRDLPVILARKLNIQHQLYRKGRSLRTTASALEFAAAVVEVLSDVCRREASEVTSAREECEQLRQQLTRLKTQDEANEEKAKRLCLEGHAFRFGYGCSPQTSQAFRMYMQAARLGAAEGFTCAGILLEDGLVETTVCEEGDSFPPGTSADTASSVSENAPTDGNDNHSLLSSAHASLCTSEHEDTEPESGRELLPGTRQRRRTLERVVRPSSHDRMAQARRLFEEAAHMGHPDALFRLGRMAEMGHGGFSKDYSRAIQFYRQAAEKGHAEAQVAVGYAYEEGKVCTKDFREALQWYQRAADQGSPTGLNNLASLYYRGCGCPVDYEQAAHLFKKAAAVGNTHACYNLAICYEFSRGVQAEDSDKALKLYLQAAQAGHVKAATALGMLLLKLNAAAAKPAEAYTEAARWLQMAALKQDPEATFVLGQLYEIGLGLTRDLEQALACYRNAAVGEANPKAHLRLAHLLFSRQGGSDLADKKEAFGHYRIAAEQGNDPEAWNCLGLCHEEGLGSVDAIPQYTEAATCYEHAIEGESVDAMCNLARLLTKGLGVARDAERGFQLLKCAACKGHLQAKFALENQGRIVPRPLLEVALGYADVGDKPPLPAVIPISPMLDGRRQREDVHACILEGATSEKKLDADKLQERADHETNTVTRALEKQHRATSPPPPPPPPRPPHNDPSSSSLEKPSCNPCNSARSTLAGRKEHGHISTSVATSEEGEGLRNKSGDAMPVARSVLPHKNVSTPNSGPPPVRTQGCAAAAFRQKGDNRKVRSNSLGFDRAQDGSRSAAEEFTSVLSPLSPGQVACWPDCSPSLSHQLSAASPAGSLFYRKLESHARNSLAHLLLVDRWALPGPSAVVPREEIHYVPSYNR